jgi:hypothetical protein
MNNRLGCLSPLAIFATAFTMLSVAAFAFFSGSQMFTAGALNATPGAPIGGVHSHEEIGKDCAKCHPAPWEPTKMEELCQGCHQDVTIQMADPVSLHGALVKNGKTLECCDCHSEHQGKTAALTSMLPKDYPHEVMGYQLLAHDQFKDGHPFACADCHVNDVQSFSQPVCTECHRSLDAAFTSQHVTDYGEDCLACHDGKETVNKNFEHNLAIFKMSGKHSQVTCEKCHVDARKKADLQSLDTTCGMCHQRDDVHKSQFGLACDDCHKVETWVGATYDHTQTDFGLLGKHADVKCGDCHNKEGRTQLSMECAACHVKDDVHKNALGNKCADCHTPAGWTPSKFDHAWSKFQLIGKHDGVACAKCHDDKIFKGTPVECFACHEQDDQHGGRLGTKCETCHSPAGWKPATFDHKLSTFKLTGAHGKVECLQCHINDVYKGTSSNCSSCHDKDDAHHGKLGNSCDNCHTTDGWVPAFFDHKQSSFKLTGAHGSVDCRKCHFNNDFIGTPSSCSACHEKDDAHGGSLGKGCESCHDTDGWSPAHFDHNQSSFKLIGRHSKADCKSCHKTMKFKDTPTSCSGCHAGDDKHGGAFGNDCGNCHSANGWLPASFDHNSKTSFKLIGSHLKVDCKGCHSNNVYKGTPTDCFGCHSGDDKHKGAFGKDCSTCHSPTTWADAKFDHNLSSFKLTGAHRSAQCKDCHSNGVYKGTPSTCVSCHDKNDSHNGAFGKDCGSCHSTNGWSGAKFDHNLSSFKLVGDHLGVGCGSCHKNGKYKGTPTNCEGCHGEPKFHAGMFDSSCANCHNENGWTPAPYRGPHSFPMKHGKKNNSCTSCHQPTLKQWSCYLCHDKAEIAKKHQEENIGNFDNCLKCHANGKN